MLMPRKVENKFCLKPTQLVRNASSFGNYFFRSKITNSGKALNRTGKILAGPCINKIFGAFEFTCAKAISGGECCVNASQTPNNQTKYESQNKNT